MGARQGVAEAVYLGIDAFRMEFSVSCLFDKRHPVVVTSTGPSCRRNTEHGILIGEE